VGKGSWLAEQVLGMDPSGQLGQEPHPRGHVPIGQEARADLFVGCFAEPSPAFGIGEHVGDRTAETGQVASVGDQDSAHAVLDLDSVSADVARYDRASLPDRLRDAEAEALLEALLDDHGRLAPERIDDHGVRVRIAQRELQQIDAIANASITPSGSLRRSQRARWTTSGAVPGCDERPVLRIVPTTGVPERRPAATSPASVSSLRASASGIERFFGKHGSMHGGMTTMRGAPSCGSGSDRRVRTMASALAA